MIENEKNGVDKKIIYLHVGTLGFQLIEKGLEENDKVILTDESFWNGMRGKNWRKFEELVQFAKEHNAQVKVIVYLRCQEQFIYSWWRQNVKTGKMDMVEDERYKKEVLRKGKIR